MTNDHDVEALGVYALGALDDSETRAIEEHLAGCPTCRDELEVLVGLRPLLAAAPPDAFETPTRGPRLALLAAAAAVLAVAVVGGILIGRHTGETVVVQQPPATTAPLVSGTLFGSGTGPTGARLTVRVEPAAGWVRVNATASGIPAGSRCRLVVVSRTGTRQTAGSWLVSPTAEKSGITLDGTALISPEDVVAVDIETFDGHQLVSAPVMAGH
jgi:anti-sigma factor RsiW